jgi:tetratricopeptide (TPR) repeat protein
MTLLPSRRTFSEPPRDARRQIQNAEDRALRFRAFVLALVSGGTLGVIGGWLVGHPFLGAFLGTGLVYGVSMGAARLAGGAASFLHGGSAMSAPPKTGYSRAEALAAQGEFEEAVSVYELALLEDPTEPEPYLRIARLQRDELKDLEEAIRWFRRAREEADLPPGQDALVLREIAEIVLYGLDDPRRAVPELTVLAEAYLETPGGEWAARELREIGGAADPSP